MTAKTPSIVYWLGDNLYLNITNQCPNMCYFCLRNFKDGVGGFNLKIKREPTVDEVISEIQNTINMRHWKEIVFCGFGEPLTRLDCVLEVSRRIRQNYGKIIAIRVDTNGQGYLLNRGRRVVEELKEAGVDRVSVSLNAHDKATYMEVCRPRFENAYESILEFIEKAKRILDVEVTALSIPEVDLDKVAEIAASMGVKFRIRQYIPGFW
ncbi:MAG: TatD family nuclease-associated radical SAM protein [Candidatus Bathyarchaeota archaeon]|nr:TatD family nuclease-associated radical SAM protein [Candidatus Bathyarchaeota archaeon]MCX8176998.1 TatD family nuclease-associated radical SAM protein [Candidatus Bathyarchaeota archaeon]MDW8194396.1 TatD family nuclease-associated radical SAM protein [Nitrososphaerota archaeon]